jgi:hypothetical protein
MEWELVCSDMLSDKKIKILSPINQTLSSLTKIKPFASRVRKSFEWSLNNWWFNNNLVIYNNKWKFKIIAYWKNSLNEQEYLEDNQPLDFGHPS